MEGEEQGDPWSFGWEEFMGRTAPVQLTDGWDVRPYIVQLFSEAGIQPAYRLGYFGEADNLVFFDRLPRSLGADTAGPIGSKEDVRRFREVLDSTIDLAAASSRGLLFVGQAGWAYDMEVRNSARRVLDRAGFRFVTRHA